MAATPFAQDELAFATKWTGEPEVAPLEGELTDTPATAGNAKIAQRHTTTESFPEFISKVSSKFRKNRREEQLSCYGY
jgi:hypothetical protein